jgi:hypothetical protein
MIDKWLSSSGACHNYQMATLPLSYRQLYRTMQHGVRNNNEPWTKCPDGETLSQPGYYDLQLLYVKT